MNNIINFLNSVMNYQDYGIINIDDVLVYGVNRGIAKAPITARGELQGYVIGNENSATCAQILGQYIDFITLNKKDFIQRINKILTGIYDLTSFNKLYLLLMELELEDTISNRTRIYIDLLNLAQEV